MQTNESLLKDILEKVTSDVVVSLKSSIAGVVEQEITKNLSKMLVEGEFYKRINSQLQTGLKEIYSEILAAKQDNGVAGPVPDRNETEKIFSETSNQLDEILMSTEKATVEIMEIVEKNLDQQEKTARMLNTLKSAAGNETLEKLIEINDSLNNDLITIMTALSFQDITGQRIKRVIHAIKKVEKTVFELYLSTGLKIKARMLQPEKDLDEIEQETKQAVEELKGPRKEVSQGDIDEILSQLGIGG